MLVVLNTDSNPASVATNFLPGPRVVYVMTSYPGQLLSRDVFLNDVVLRLVNESTGELPKLEGRALSSDEHLVMPPHSYGFVVHPSAKALACA